MSDDIPEEQIQEVLRMVEERLNAVEEIPTCDLPFYQTVVSELPRPGKEQIRNFVGFVAEAHSWYKHLPSLPPGQPFHFFLDPLSGFDVGLEPGGEVVLSERREDTPLDERFHYTWMSTAVYRRRFGHLSYETGAAPQFLMSTGGGLHEDADRPVFYTQQSAYRLPPEVCRVGSVPLTTVIHPETAQTWIWKAALLYGEIDTKEGSTTTWPESTGGQSTLDRIVELAEETETERTARCKKDEELDRLLKPERERLHTLMEQAITRMLDLVYDDPGS